VILAKAVVSIFILVALFVFLTKKQIERLWKSSKLKTFLLGFLMGAFIGLLIYLFEKYWYSFPNSKPLKIMPFAIIPIWNFNWVKTKAISTFLQFKIVIKKIISFHL